MKKYLLLAFTLIIFLSCTKSLIQISPEYQNRYIDAEKLYIQFLPEQLVIEINDALISSLGTGSKNEIYISYFEKTFPKFVKQNSTFQQVLMTSKEYQFDEKEYNINDKEKILLKIPSHLKNETILDDHTGYSIILEDIKIHHKN